MTTFKKRKAEENLQSGKVKLSCSDSDCDEKKYQISQEDDKVQKSIEESTKWDIYYNTPDLKLKKELFFELIIIPDEFKGNVQEAQNYMEKWRKDKKFNSFCEIKDNLIYITIQDRNSHPLQYHSRFLVPESLFKQISDSIDKLEDLELQNIFFPPQSVSILDNSVLKMLRNVDNEDVEKILEHESLKKNIDARNLVDEMVEQPYYGLFEQYYVPEDMVIAIRAEFQPQGFGLKCLRFKISDK